MNILDIIEKKRDKKELTKEEIEYFIKNYTNRNSKNNKNVANECKNSKSHIFLLKKM